MRVFVCDECKCVVFGTTETKTGYYFNLSIVVAHLWSNGTKQAGEIKLQQDFEFKMAIFQREKQCKRKEKK